VHFISYSGADGASFVKLLEQALGQEAPALEVWIDRDRIRPGRDWDSQIDAALGESDSLLFVMTPDSVEDGSICKLEYRRAMGYKKPVIPLWAHPEVEVPFLLEGRQWIDFTRDFRAALEKLRRHLEWLRTPEGELQELKDRMQDAKRDLRREAAPHRRRRLEKEIRELEREVDERRRAMRDPEAARRRADERIERGLARMREPDAPGRGRGAPRRVNAPPMSSPITSRTVGTRPRCWRSICAAIWCGW
jgi:hypothetical protein